MMVNRVIPLISTLLVLILSINYALAESIKSYTQEYRFSQIRRGIEHAYPKPIPVSTAEFDIVVGSNRNYSVLVVFTAASSQMNCEPCKRVAPIIDLLSSSLNRRVDSETPTFIANLDFAHGRDIFMRYGIQSIPILMFFPPDVGPRAKPSGSYEVFNSNGEFYPEDISEWISGLSGSNIHLSSPIDFASMAVKVVFVISILLTIRSFFDQIKAVLSSRKLWSFFCIGWTVVMCSGYMWSNIRGSPYTGATKGQPSLISGGFQYQFGIEPQIVSFLYASLSILFISLLIKLPENTVVSSQRISAYVSIGMFLFLYSVLLAVFRIKYPAYPYGLFF